MQVVPPRRHCETFVRLGKQNTWWDEHFSYKFEKNYQNLMNIRKNAAKRLDTRKEKGQNS